MQKSTITFPADAVTTCLRGNQTVSNPDAHDVRRRTGSDTSCDFLDLARNEVFAHFQTGMTKPTYEVNTYSVPMGRNVLLHCRPDGMFTYCEGGHAAQIWIRNL